MPFVNDDIINADLVAAKAKIETTYGVAEALTGADGVMMSNFKLTPLKATHEDSNIVTGKSGNSKKFLKYILADLAFDIELGRVEGDATIPPAAGQFLRVAGWDEYIEVDHVRYQLAANLSQQDSITFETQIDDRIYLMSGCRGTSMIKWTEDKRLMASFKLECQFVMPTTGAFAQVDYSKYARAMLINPDNIALCTQKAADVVTHSIEFDVAAKVERIASVNQSLIAHTGMTPSCKSTIRLPKLAQWNIEQDIANEAEDWIKVGLGTVAGRIIEMDIYSQYLNVDFTDDTPRKANITHHPIPDAATTGVVIRFK
jgi:hypothetical protein